MRRVYTFRSEGLDYDVRAKLRTLDGFGDGPRDPLQYVAGAFRRGQHHDAVLEFATIERMIIQTKVKIERLVSDFDVLRAVARDLRDVIRSGDPATTEDHDADHPRREEA
jgi:hypothetical protein